jgi:hypothetical protein
MKPGSPRRLRRALLILGACWLVLSTAWVARRAWAVLILEGNPGFNVGTAWQVPFQAGQVGATSIPLWVKLLPISYIQSIGLSSSDNYTPETGWAVKVCGRVDEVLIIGTPRGNRRMDGQKAAIFLAALGPLPELRKLTIREVNMTDADLAPLLAGYPQLRKLQMLTTVWTGADFPAMQQLERIVIYDSPISDAGLAAILHSPALQSIDITQGEITSDGIRQIPRDRQPALREISIHGAKIADDEEEKLNDLLQAACPDLESRVTGRFLK